MNQNSDLTIHVGEREHRADCQGCQTEEGSKATGLKTRKDIPVDTRKVRCTFKDDDLVTYGVFCQDCLIRAKDSGVIVIQEHNKETWQPDGFILRPELLK